MCGCVEAREGLQAAVDWVYGRLFCEVAENRGRIQMTRMAVEDSFLSPIGAWRGSIWLGRHIGNICVSRRATRSYVRCYASGGRRSSHHV